MNIDHIFIFTEENGKAADALLEFGFTEGSNRVHVGQGTTNRKFYFENFFLEILWVHDKNEITSVKTKPMGLWKRAEYRSNHFSRFGLCMVNTEDTDPIFEQSFTYQPEYFPVGKEIEIIKNETQPDLPWTFRLPFKGQKKYENEPTTHHNGISTLTKAVFDFETISDQTFIPKFMHQPQIQFAPASKQWLHLIFDNRRQAKRQEFESLSLTIEY